jgi:spore coat polysaccharide biosynthesis predicted glycosyltransferase SpsG
MSASTRSAPPPTARERAAEALVEIILEGGSRLGFGHAGRCLALWEELGPRAVFQVRDAAVAGFLQGRGAPVEDGGEAPIVVLDRAAPVAVAEVLALHNEGRLAVLIDDLGPARSYADAVVDPPTAARWPDAAGLRLAGFEHALLRREVRDALLARGEQSTRSGVVLAMGGSDPAGCTPLLARVLSAAGVEVKIALGPGYRGLFPTEGSVLGAADEFIPALAGSELLIAGYGHSLLEAAHLGVPAIAVVLTPEHLPHARAFCAHGTALMFDLTARSRAPQLADMTARLMDEPRRRAAMSVRAAGLVDGLGARRVARALMELL